MSVYDMNLAIRFLDVVTNKYSISPDRDKMVEPDASKETHPFLYGWRGFVEVSLGRHMVFSDSVPTAFLASLYSAGCTVDQAVSAVIYLADTVR